MPPANSLQYLHKIQCSHEHSCQSIYSLQYTQKRTQKECFIVETNSSFVNQCPSLFLRDLTEGSFHFILLFCFAILTLIGQGLCSLKSLFIQTMLYPEYSVCIWQPVLQGPIQHGTQRCAPTKHNAASLPNGTTKSPARQVLLA